MPRLYTLTPCCLHAWALYPHPVLPACLDPMPGDLGAPGQQRVRRTCVGRGGWVGGGAHVWGVVGGGWGALLRRVGWGLAGTGG